MLAYWDIYKNYYANKQEEIGFVVGSDNFSWTSATLKRESGTPNYTFSPTAKTAADIVWDWQTGSGFAYLMINTSSKIVNIKDVGLAMYKKNGTTTSTTEWEYVKLAESPDFELVSNTPTSTTWKLIKGSFTIPKNVIPIGVQNDGISLTKFIETMKNIIYNFSKREEKKKLYSMVNINKTGNNKNISTDYEGKRKNKSNSIVTGKQIGRAHV